MGADKITAVVDPATGFFCEDGLKPGRIVVEVPDNPDPTMHRYSGDDKNPIRTATPDEIAAVKAKAMAVIVDGLVETPVILSLIEEVADRLKLSADDLTASVKERVASKFS